MTNALRLIPVECGWLKADAGGLSKAASGLQDFPVSAWIVDHPKGRVLFDSGLHADFLTNHDRLADGDATFKVDLKHGLDQALAGSEIRADQIDIIIFSHLHWDHCGGTHAVPNARIMVQKNEWAFGQEEISQLFGYNKADYDLGHDVVQIDGEHDVFDDGSVICVPTPGHTAGHQSLRVNLESGPVLLVADCCYWSSMLEENVLPPFGHDHEM